MNSDLVQFLDGALIQRFDAILKSGYKSDADEKIPNDGDEMIAMMNKLLESKKKTVNPSMYCHL